MSTVLDSRSFLRWCWRQLTSMRIALVLLLLLAVAAIPGSLFPQRSQNPIQVKQFFIEVKELLVSFFCGHRQVLKYTVLKHGITFGNEQLL